VVSAHGPGTEGAGTRVCGYAIQYSVFSNCLTMVTVSPSGPRKLFKGVTTATSGVLARFPWLLPVRNPVAGYGASAVTRTPDRGHVHTSKPRRLLRGRRPRATRTPSRVQTPHAHAACCTLHRMRVAGILWKSLVVGRAVASARSTDAGGRSLSPTRRHPTEAGQ
jgi:hypothetical protein